MIRFLLDPANAITATGVSLSAAGVVLAASGRPELAIAAGLLAMIADHADGYVAGRLANRDSGTAAIGKNLDGFGDLLYGAVLPASVIASISDYSLLSLALEVFLVAVAALRLSYFATHGKTSTGQFVGVPLSYDILVLAALHLISPLLRPDVAQSLMCFLFFALGVLHVTPQPVPPLNRYGYVASIGFGLICASYFAFRSLSDAGL